MNYTHKPRNARDIIGRSFTWRERIEFRIRYAGPARYALWWFEVLLRAIWIGVPFMLFAPVALLSMIFDWLFDKVAEPATQWWGRIGDKLIPSTHPTKVTRGWECMKDDRLFDVLEDMGFLTHQERRELQERFR